MVYSCRSELAEKPTDILCRRFGIAFLDESLASDLVPKIVEVMAKEKGWGRDRAERELKEAREMIRENKM